MKARVEASRNVKEITRIGNVQEVVVDDNAYYRIRFLLMVHGHDEQVCLISRNERS